KLLVGLLPSVFGISLGTYQPRWREWGPDEPPPFNPVDWGRQIDPVVERLLADAGVDGARWVDLVGVLDDVPADSSQAILSRLDDLDPDILDSGDRTAIAGALRDLVESHRRFPEATWAL